MKEPTAKELHKQLIDQFLQRHFKYFLDQNPGKRTEAALYAAGRLEALLLGTLQELPGYHYNDLIRKLKG